MSGQEVANEESSSVKLISSDLDLLVGLVGQGAGGRAADPQHLQDDGLAVRELLHVGQHGELALNLVQLLVTSPLNLRVEDEVEDCPSQCGGGCLTAGSEQIEDDQNQFLETVVYLPNTGMKTYGSTFIRTASRLSTYFLPSSLSNEKVSLAAIFQITLTEEMLNTFLIKKCSESLFSII